MIEQIKTIKKLRAWREELRRAGKTMSYVPTMGALHDGHLQLVKKGFEVSDVCLPYIFINPKQFAANEDLGKYPKTLDADLEKLESVGVSHVYVPQADEIYPPGFQTMVSISDISQPLEGEFRPHFFQGMCTVVCKMLLQAMPDIALFGEKDYQQLQVIKRMALDLDMPIEIVGVPTVRDDNGLALSSRNIYLSKEEYKIAAQLNVILKDMAHKKLDEAQAHEKILAAGFDKIDYCAARNGENFEKENANRVLAAVWLGKTRLIDNMAMV